MIFIGFLSAAMLLAFIVVVAIGAIATIVGFVIGSVGYGFTKNLEMLNGLWIISTIIIIIILFSCLL